MGELKQALEEIARRLNARIEQKNSSQQINVEKHTIVYSQQGTLCTLTYQENSDEPISMTVKEGQQEHTFSYCFHPRRYMDVRRIISEASNVLANYLLTRIAGYDSGNGQLHGISIQLGKKQPFFDIPEFIEKHVRSK